MPENFRIRVAALALSCLMGAVSVQGQTEKSVSGIQNPQGRASANAEPEIAQSHEFDEKRLDHVLWHCQKLLDKQDVTGAIEALTKFNELSDDVRVSPENRLFVGFTEFAVDFPGLDETAKLSVRQKQHNYVEVPGIDCTDEADPEWYSAAFRFAVRHNMWVLFFSEEAGSVRASKTMDEVRDTLGINEQDWQKLPLENRMRIRLMATKYFDEIESRLKRQDAIANEKQRP